jgi:hypothetical protein
MASATRRSEVSAAESTSARDAPGQTGQRQRQQRRAAAVHARGRHPLAGQLLDGTPDRLLQRMIRRQVAGGRPAVLHAGRQHRGVFARAVHPDPGLVLAAGDQAACGLRIERPGGRAAQVILAQAGPRQDLPHAFDVEVLTGVARRGQRQQLAVQLEAAAQHRRGLQRLVGRPREERHAGLPDADHLGPVGAQPGYRTAVP